MCFAPQRRALFRHLNYQKWSEPLVFFNILTSKCASHHNGVHFFDISTAKSSPDLVCFVDFDFKMCFTPQRRALFRHLNFQKWSDTGVFREPQIIGKTQFFATFAHLHLLSSYSFSSTLLSSDLSLLSASALLCFSSVHIVGSLTSKLPSTTYCYT